MRTFLTLITFALSVLVVTPSFAAETKKVCNTTKDAKTGKTKEVCKNIKIHKKLEVEEVPAKKK